MKKSAKKITGKDFIAKNRIIILKESFGGALFKCSLFVY